MFKILAGDYGNPPLRVELDSAFGVYILTILPADPEKLNGFNNRSRDLWQVVERLNSKEHVTKIEIVNEENVDKYSRLGAFNTVLGVAQYGPVGTLMGNLDKVKKEILFYVETKVGNAFMAKADGKTFKSFNEYFGISEKESAQETFEQMKEGTNPELLDSVQKENDLTTELEKLASLKEKGLLTDKEFSAAKAKLLS